MKRTAKKLFLCLTAALLVVQMSALSVFADTAGYTTNRFDVNVTVEENHVFHVAESISVDFKQAKHGIYRYIPYEPGIYSVGNFQVEGDKFQVETQNDNGVSQKVLRVGDADKTLKGRHTYRISYDIIGFEDDSTAKDYFSLDLLPIDWETDIKASHIELKFPKPVDADSFQIYSGNYGFDENFYGIEADYNVRNRVVTIDTTDMMRGVGLTLNTELPQGYWVGAASRDWMVKPLMAVLIGLPLLMAVLWFIFGRDPKVVKTVEFYPPEGMTPAEIGYIIDGTVDTKDITSLIIYFASKGWLSIHEYESDKFELIKQSEIDRSEKTFSKTIFNSLFIESDRVKLTNLPEAFGEMFMAAKSQLRGSFRRENALFTSSSRLCRGIGMVLMFLPAAAAILIGALISFNYVYTIMLLPTSVLLAVGLFMVIVTFDKKETYSKVKVTVMMLIAFALILTGSALAGATLAVAVNMMTMAFLVIASMLTTFIFVLLMNKRTEQSAKWQGQILGFRDFIERAELEKLNLLVEENPEYFYNIMPYAYVMGLSDKWAENFQNIAMSKPGWYSGYDSGNTMFNTFWYMHMFNHCTRTFAGSTMTSIAGGMDVGGGGSSGIGGGFGGGGFTGGGFGGGGGGAW